MNIDFHDDDISLAKKIRILFSELLKEDIEEVPFLLETLENDYEIYENDVEKELYVEFKNY